MLVVAPTAAPPRQIVQQLLSPNGYGRTVLLEAVDTGSRVTFEEILNATSEEIDREQVRLYLGPACPLVSMLGLQPAFASDPREHADAVVLSSTHRLTCGSLVVNGVVMEKVMGVDGQRLTRTEQAMRVR